MLAIPVLFQIQENQHMENKAILFFLGKMLLFISPVVILIVYLEVNLRKIPNSYNVKRKFLEQNLHEIEVLNIGSSQALFGLNPHILHPHCFNVAEIAQTIYYDRRIIEKYLQRMPNLKLVIIPVSYHVLWQQMHDGTEQWRENYYYQYWGIDFPETNWYDIKKYSAVFLYEPKYVFGIALKNFKLNYAADIDSSGWVSNANIGSDSTINDTLGFKRVMQHNNAIVPSRLPYVVNDLSLLISHLQERNITAVFVTIPVYETYSKFMRPDIVEKRDSVIQSLCTQYHMKCYAYEKDKRFTMVDFFDNDHLNKYGAEKMSKIIKSDIIDPFFESRDAFKNKK